MVLVKLVRRQVRPGDLIGRLGGEEFGVLLHNISEPDAIDKAENICLQVEKHSFKMNGDVVIPVTISIGITMFKPEVNFSSEQLYKSVDAQLYRAKVAGRNRVAIDSKESL